MSKKTFAEAEAYCTSHGLLLAQPVDPEALRQYLIANGGMFFNHIYLVYIVYIYFPNRHVAIYVAQG